jgi:hypothetical protein
MAEVVSEDFDLEWENTVGPRVKSFSDLASDIAGWLILSPLRVHPDYRATAWATVRKAVECLSDARRANLASRLDLWRFVCRPDSEATT